MKRLKFTNEYALLLACARLRMDERAQDNVRHLLAAGLDWDRLVEIAYQHQVVSLLYEHIKELGGDAVPEQFLTRFKELSIVTTSWNVRYNYELSKVFEALRSKNIAVMLLKGMALVHTVYESLALRPMNDVDILVKEGDLREIRSSLHDLGYDPPESQPDLDGREAVEYCHYFDQIKFYNKDRIMFDTHFRLLNMGVPAADERTVWERACEVTLRDGGTALVPSPEAMLLHLCFHANHHHYSRIMHFCDINETYRRYADTLDWEYLHGIVVQRRLGASFYHTLLFTRELMGADMPDDLLDRFKPRHIRRKLYEGFWRNAIAGGRRRFTFGNMQGPIFYLLEMDGLADKARFVLKSMFPPSTWLAHRFHSKASVRLYLKYQLSLLKQLFASFGSSPRGVVDGENRK